jgi:hypothetical protein
MQGSEEELIAVDEIQEDHEEEDDQDQENPR